MFVRTANGARIGLARPAGTCRETVKAETADVQNVDPKRLTRVPAGSVDKDKDDDNDNARDHDLA